MQLFFPPNVAGWPGGKTFIDSSTLLMRMRLPSALLNNGQIDVEEKIDDPDDQAKTNISENKKLETSVNWGVLLDETKDLDLNQLLKIYLLKQPTKKVVDKIKSDLILGQKEMIVKIVSLPEYNLA